MIGFKQVQSLQTEGYENIMFATNFDNIFRMQPLAQMIIISSYYIF